MAENKKKKKVVIISIIAGVIIIAGIIAAVSMNKESDPPGKDLKANQVEIVNEEGEVEVVEKDSKEAKEYDQAVKSGDRKDVSSVQKTENKNNASSNKGNSSSAGNSGSASSNVEKPTTHTHNWVETQGVEYVERNILGSRCNGCGYSTTTPGAIGAHMDANWKTCGSYSTDVVIGTETVAEYYTYYKCSCGATSY